MKKSITYKQLFQFNSAANSYLKRIAKTDKKNAADDAVPENKLTASIKSVFKQIKKDEFFEAYNEMVLDNSLAYCAVDDQTKTILKDTNGDLKFTVENQKKLNCANKELLKKTVEIHTRTLPENDALISILEDIEVEAFAGIVISETTEEK